MESETDQLSGETEQHITFQRVTSYLHETYMLLHAQKSLMGLCQVEY